MFENDMSINLYQNIEECINLNQIYLIYMKIVLYDILSRFTLNLSKFNNIPMKFQIFNI